MRIHFIYVRQVYYHLNGISFELQIMDPNVRQHNVLWDRSTIYTYSKEYIYFEQIQFSLAKALFERVILYGSWIYT